jgi:peptide/nickel transport system permease protein
MDVAQASMPVEDLPATRWWRLLRRFTRHRLAFTGLIILIVLVVFTAFGPFVWQKSIEEIDLKQRMLAPGLEHPLGTDEHGRDVLARMMQGGRVSLMVGLAASLISILVGGLCGVTAGFFGGLADTIIMRITDALMSIPLYFLLLVVLSITGAGFGNIIWIIGLTAWMSVARVIRSEVLRVRELEFIVACRAVGATDLRIVLRHVVPQVLNSLLVASTLNVAYAILVESALSYLGLGVQPPMPSWGNMLSDARSHVFTDSRLAIYPGIGILITVMAFNAVGDGLRDVLDPMGLRD